MTTNKKGRAFLALFLPLTTVSSFLIASANLAQAQEYQGCWMIRSNGSFVSLNNMCPVPATTAATASQTAIPLPTIPVPNFTSDINVEEPGYCESLSSELQMKCFNRYDRNGFRYGTSNFGRRYGGSSRSTDNYSDRGGSCTYTWQVDSAGRECGGRASTQRRGGN